MRMSRYWITGCMALVLLAAGQASGRADSESSRRGWITRTSRYSVDETIEKLEQAAQERGIVVFAKLDNPSGAVRREEFAATDTRTSPVLSQVLVLAPDDEGTPVMQADGSRARLELPLQIRVEQGPDGQTVVAVNDSAYLAEQGEAPPEMLSNVAALPGLIDSALG